ncbi:MAG: hypothetical protein LKF61_00905 [Eggerthellaceae bacterium]|jgi:hypothetical protein|nr:hypothetical protein [Eggerthellaceae bacterium]
MNIKQIASKHLAESQSASLTNFEWIKREASFEEVQATIIAFLNINLALESKVKSMAVLRWLNDEHKKAEQK